MHDGIARQRTRRASTQESAFVRDMTQVMRDYRQARRAGMSREDAVKGLEVAVLELWPRGRQEPWHHYCDDCGDSGLRTVHKPSEVYGGTLVAFKEPCGCEKGRVWHEAHRPKREDESDQAANRKVAARWNG